MGKKKRKGKLRKGGQPRGSPHVNKYEKFSKEKK